MTADMAVWRRTLLLSRPSVERLAVDSMTGFCFVCSTLCVALVIQGSIGE